MQDQVEDWLQEGSVYAQMRKVIRDAARIGSGVLKGPVPMIRRDRRWLAAEDGSMAVEIVERIAPGSKAISAWDVLPDPSAGDNIHDGAFCFERDYLTGRAVRDLASQPDYDRQAIIDVLRQGPQRTGRYDDRQDREQQGEVNTHDRDTFESWYYYGDLTPETIVAGGWMVAGMTGPEGEAMAAQLEDETQLVTIPVIVTMINDRIVKMSLNPMDTGGFPYDVFPWEPVVGQPWGRGIPTKMAPAAKMLTAATRALLENAGLSAGPQIVLDRKAIEPGDGQWSITGRKLWFWVPGEEVKDIRAAFQVINIESAQQQLQAVIEYALSLADQLSNLPLLLQGAMGQAPDTVGGMTMLTANATGPLKAIAKQWDDSILVPHLRRYYEWAMTDPEVSPEAKGDMQTVPRTSTALIQRDVAAQFLPQLLPYVKDPTFELDPKRFIAELLRANKISPESLSLTPEELQAAQETAAQQPPPEDPRVQAANIKADQDDKRMQSELQDAQQQREFEAQQASEDRAHEKLISDVEFQIQAMEFAGQKEISFDQLKAMLAVKAMDLKTKREMFAAERALKLDPSNPTNQGL
jgi:hypothetical protein